MAPAEELGAGPVVVFLEQRVLREVGGLLQRRRRAGGGLLDQARAGAWGDALAEQPDRIVRHTGGVAVADQDLGVGVVEVAQGVAGVDADVELFGEEGRCASPMNYWLVISPARRDRPEVRRFAEWVQIQAALTRSMIGE